MRSTEAGGGGKDRDGVAARWPHLRRPIEDRLLGRCRDGEGVLLIGAPGAGKTSLASHLIEDRRASGAHVVELAGAPGQRDISFGALRRVVRPPEGLVLAELLRWGLQHLPERADGAPLLFGIDDAQHLDDLTASLVHQLVVMGRAAVVITMREGTTLPDAVERLVRDGSVRRTHVEPLTAREVGEVLRTALGGPVAAATAAALARASGGNPLHLRELCAQGMDSGLLSPAGGTWRWDGAISVHGDLRQLLLDRIHGLDQRSQHALELLAFAEVLGMGECERLVGTDVVDGLERRRLLAVDKVGRRDEVRLAHPLFDEVLRDGAEARAGTIQRLLADAVEASGARRAADLGRVAEWRLAAGERLEPEKLLAAADAAAVTFHHARAERLATAAIAAGGGAAAQMLRAAILAEGGRVDDAEALWAAIALPPGDPLRTEVDLVRAENLYFGLGRTEDARALLHAARARAASVEAVGQVVAKQAMLQLYEGRTSEARATAAELMETGSPQVRRRAAVFLVPALAMEGRCDEALATVDQVLGDPEGDDGDIYRTGELLAGRFLALAFGGRLAEAVAHARSIRDLSATIGADEGVAIFGLAVGHATLMLGRVDEALGALDEAAAQLRQHDRTGYLRWCLGELAAARTLAGDLAAAADALAEAERHRGSSSRLLDCRLELAHARHAVATGRPEEAHGIAAAAGHRAIDGGQRVFAAEALHLAVRLRPPGSPGVDPLVESLQAVADATDTPIAAALARHAGAFARRDGAGARAAAWDLLRADLRVHAAEALHMAADAHLECGEPAPALACALSASVVAHACDGAAENWLPPSPAERLLGKREVEVALRTAAGLSSRAVADELFISVRTVENHLHRVYAKLELQGRDELAAAFRTVLDANEWCVAQDRSDGASYVPAHTGPLEVEWLRTP